MRPRLRSAFLAALLASAPLAARAAYNVDLGIAAGDVSFSKDTLVSGDRVRLYATVHNYGSTDAESYVSFFQGSVPIGDSQVVSLRAGHYPEDVYVDFVVPTGAFNIRAELRGADPADENPGNDVAITGLFNPIQDDDRDGVPNAKDDCPADANADQHDTDQDGVGDACDADMDNDGLSNAVESELGTNPRVKDTDGDGVPDAQDAYPLDPRRWSVEPAPKAAVKPAESLTAAPKPASKPAAAPVAKTAAKTAAVPPAQAPAPEPAPTPAPAAAPAEVHAAFGQTRTAWNAFAFTAFAPEDPGYLFAWDFGDGSTSTRRETSHTYRRNGSYAVKLTVTDPAGRTASDSVTVRVPFFSLHNPVVIALLGVLALVVLFGTVLALRAGKRVPRPAVPPPEEKEQEEEDDEDEPDET